MSVPAENASTGRAFWAFISYSHQDEKWATWLHRNLETYRIPKHLVGGVGRSGEAVPRRLYPVFRDRDELGSAASLSDRIQEMLRSARFLVVICSPAAVRSKWVAEEIKTFAKLVGAANTLALVVSGEPNATDNGNAAEECFPEPLRYRVGADGELTAERAEPLAADARDDKDGKRGALLKIIAAIAGVGYDDLRQRDARRRLRMLSLAASVLGAIAISMAALATYALYQERSAIATRLATASRFEADKHHDLALLLATEGVHLRNTLETRSALLSALLWQPQRVAPLNHHRNETYGLAFSPDGRTLATGDAGGEVVLWDVASRKRTAMRPIDAGGEVTSLAFSPDGQRLAVANRVGSFNAGALSYWNVKSGLREFEPAEHDETPWAIRFSSDGASLLVADGDGQATLWKVGHSRPEWRSVAANELAGFDVAIDPAEKWLAVGSDSGGELSLVSLVDRKEVFTLETKHSVGIHGLAFSAAGETLVTADWLGRIVFWNTASRSATSEPFESGIKEIYRIALAPDGGQLALGGSDGSVLLWDMAKHEPGDLILSGHGDAVRSLLFSPDSQRLAIGLQSGLVYLADLTDGERLVRTQNLAGDAWDVAVAADGRAIVATSGGVRRVAIDPAHGRDDTLLVAGFAWRVALSPDRATFAALRTCEEGRNPRKEVVIGSLIASGAAATVVSSCNSNDEVIAFSADGNTLAVGKLDGTIDLRRRDGDWVADATLGAKASLEKAVDGIAISSDRRLLGVGRRDGTLELWSMADRTMARSWRAHANSVGALAFSPDGRLVASGSFDRSLQLWNVTDASALGPPLLLQSDVGALTFSPDGTLLASTGGNDSVLLWEVATMQALGEPLEADRGVSRTGGVRALAFSSDGRYLVTVGTDARLFRWDLRLETLIRQACYGANRDFTEQEWQSYGSHWGRHGCQQTR